MNRLTLNLAAVLCFAALLSGCGVPDATAGLMRDGESSLRAWQSTGTPQSAQWASFPSAMTR